MNIEKKHEILTNWVTKKYNQPSKIKDEWLLVYGHMNDYLKLNILLFKKWQELLKKGYSDDQLIDYFIEIIRYYLPEFKGTKLYFSVNIYDEKTYEII